MHVTEATISNKPLLFLATKVVPPRLPTGLIDRPRLASLAAQTEKKRLTVIKAPAGFGKTSPRAWLAQRARDEQRARGRLARLLDAER